VGRKIHAKEKEYKRERERRGGGGRDLDLTLNIAPPQVFHTLAIEIETMQKQLNDELRLT